MDKEQKQNVEEYYDAIAHIYDEEFENRADYQIPRILKAVYIKYKIEGGLILDVGCGTGKLKEYLGDEFSYMGIDISSSMILIARGRGYKTFLGRAEDVIKTFPDKSFDHIVALSSLYFIKDFNGIFSEFERVASKSIFISLEQFTPNIMKLMKNKGISLYNHDFSVIKNPTEVMKGEYLWHRPNTNDKIFGDIVFKKLGGV